MTKVLLADDDTVLAELLEEFLTAEDFDVVTVHDGKSAVEQEASGQFDVVVLDVMMPVMDGLEALRRIRAKSQTPTLMLTARGDDIDRINGLELGADDYLPKPCNPRELVARIRAVLRRTQAGAANTEQREFSVGDLELRLDDRSTNVKGESVELTTAEFNILVLLVASAGQVVDKEVLYAEALGRPFGAYDRSADMHISHLRRKLGPLDSGESRIKTVRGRGYQYIVTSE
ncbi:MAG: response regulator transcription factor [Gammaproteobacteria bacterium]|nr:response regulator transcription factor [Gammaproteobacteria bacterium]